MTSQYDEIVTAMREQMEQSANAYIPLYHRVQRAIRHTIEDGLLEADDALLPERDLGQALGVSRVTVRNAIRDLVEEGLLVQKRGAGTFVSRRVEMSMTSPTSFSEDMIARGMDPEYQMLDQHTGPATPLECEMLKVEPTTQVTRLYRLRYASKKRMCLELASVPADFLPSDGDFGSSLYSHFAEKNMRPSRAMQRLRAEILDAEKARLLGVTPGAAGLFIEQQSFLPDGTPVEYVRSHYRGDAYDFVIELKM